MCLGPSPRLTSLLEGAEDRRWGAGGVYIIRGLSYSREETGLILVLETQKEKNLKEAIGYCFKSTNKADFRD